MKNNAKSPKRCHAKRLSVELVSLMYAYQAKQAQLLKVQQAVRDYEIKTKTSATESAKKLKR